MKQDEIIEMARESASHGVENHRSGEVTYVFYNEHLMNFAKLVAEKERERISQKIAQLPFGDTAQSLSIWVKNDT
jgi:hypothetical protein